MDPLKAKVLARGLQLESVINKKSSINKAVWDTMYKGALSEYNGAYSRYLDKYVEDNRQELESAFILKAMEDGRTQEQAEFVLKHNYGLFMQYVSDTVTI